MLIVMEHRDFHPGTEHFLDDEALRCLDVLKVDGPESRLQGRDHLDQLIGIVFGDLDVEAIDIGEFLEQDGFAFHDRLRRQSADGAQAQYGGAIGNDGNQVAAVGHFIGLRGILDDDAAGGGDTRRIGQRQVALRRQWLGGLDLQFAGPRQPMVFERSFIQGFVVSHLPLPDRP